ncbi:MAG: HAD-IIA family hydrolase [Magnetococcales bacterium]|nr:HAD-IIA family hydrolase [Magnetococcales bacterium]
MKPILPDWQTVTAQYARYRTRLCQADERLAARLRAGRMERVAFSALSHAYDLLLLDAFGVLNRGQEAIAGAAATLERLRDRGQNFLVVSNNASQSPARVAQQLGSMGLAIPPEAIVTSGMAVRPSLAHSPWRDWPYYLVGTPDSKAAYAPDPERLCVNDRTGAGWQAARYIILCSNRDYYGTRQQAQVEHLLARQRLPILLANPDLVAPATGGDLAVVAGYTAAEWITRYHCDWIGLGKPFAPLYALVRERFPAISPQRILMVGDTLETDILGGAAQGWDTCLTLSGVSASEALATVCNQREIRPDFVVQSIAT